MLQLIMCMLLSHKPPAFVPLCPASPGDWKKEHVTLEGGNIKRISALFAAPRLRSRSPVTLVDDVVIDSRRRRVHSS